MVFWWSYARKEEIKGTEEIECRLKRDKLVNAS